MKVFRSLPQHLEDEAVACYDKQYDQNVFASEQVEKLTSIPQKEREKDRLFYFVFGYAQAKGWTDADMRMKR